MVSIGRRNSWIDFGLLWAGFERLSQCAFGRVALGFETVLRGVVVESFPGSLIEFTHHVGDVGAAVEGEVGALGKVLPREPVEVLVRAALPGRVRFAEVDRDSGRGGEVLMSRHPHSLIPGQGPFQMSR